jgi:uncharacterized protein RhaS with RHS repeats
MNLFGYAPNPVSWVDPLGWCAETNVASKSENDFVTLYHGSKKIEGDRFTLHKATEKIKQQKSKSPAHLNLVYI